MKRMINDLLKKFLESTYSNFVKLNKIIFGINRKINSIINNLLKKFLERVYSKFNNLLVGIKFKSEMKKKINNLLKNFLESTYSKFNKFIFDHYYLIFIFFFFFFGLFFFVEEAFAEEFTPKAVLNKGVAGDSTAIVVIIGSFLLGYGVYKLGMWFWGNSITGEESDVVAAAVDSIKTDIVVAAAVDSIKTDIVFAKANVDHIKIPSKFLLYNGFPAEGIKPHIVGYIEENSNYLMNKQIKMWNNTVDIQECIRLIYPNNPFNDMITNDLNEFNRISLLNKTSKLNINLCELSFNSQYVIADAMAGFDIIESNIIEQDVIEQEIIEQDIIEQDIIESNIIEQDVIEQDIIESNIIEQDVIEQDIIESNIIEQDVIDDARAGFEIIEQDIIEQDVIEQDVIEQDVIEQNIIEQDVIEQNIIEQNVIEQDIIEQNPIEQEIIEQNVIEHYYEFDAEGKVGLKNVDVEEYQAWVDGLRESFEMDEDLDLGRFDKMIKELIMAQITNTALMELRLLVQEDLYDSVGYHIALVAFFEYYESTVLSVYNYLSEEGFLESGEVPRSLAQDLSGFFHDGIRSLVRRHVLLLTQRERTTIIFSTLNYNIDLIGTGITMLQDSMINLIYFQNSLKSTGVAVQNFNDLWKHQDANSYYDFQNFLIDKFKNINPLSNKYMYIFSPLYNNSLCGSYWNVPEFYNRESLIIIDRGILLDLLYQHGIDINNEFTDIIFELDIEMYKSKQIINDRLLNNYSYSEMLSFTKYLELCEYDSILMEKTLYIDYLNKLKAEIINIAQQD